MPTLLILSKHADEYRRLIEAANLPDLKLFTATEATQVADQDADFEIIFGMPSLICEVLPHLDCLRWVQATWAGVEPLLDPSLRRDYILTNARGVFGGLMSEYVFSYMLTYERRILERQQAQIEQRWDSTVTGTLRGKTLGLLGVGSIGAHLANTAKHFGMRVLGYTRTSETCPDVDHFYHDIDLPELARELDYLVNVLPNTSKTRQIVNAELLSILPVHTIFINVGRGSTVDEAALVEALHSGTIAGAALDVFEHEPLPKSHPFWSTPNLFITFHTAAPSFPADITNLFIENYERFVSDQRLNYQVDFERGY